MLGNRHEGSGSGARDRSSRLPCALKVLDAQGAGAPCARFFFREFTYAESPFSRGREQGAGGMRVRRALDDANPCMLGHNNRYGWQQHCCTLCSSQNTNCACFPTSSPNPFSSPGRRRGATKCMGNLLT